MRFLKLPIMAMLLLFLGSIQSQAAVNLIDCIDDDPNGVTLLQTTGVNVDACMAQATAQDGTVYLPKGKMLLTATEHLKKRIHFIGEGSGQDGIAVTVLKVSADQGGFVVHRCDTDYQNGAYVIVPCDNTKRADGSIFEGFRLEGSGTLGHGISLKARATIREVNVAGFGENCINIVAYAVDPTPLIHGNDNNWRVDTVRLTGCKNGLFVQGLDANAGTSIAVDASLNDEYGIVDLSGLGNTHIGPHTAANGFAGYKTEGASNRTVFIGAYAEEDQDPSPLGTQTTIVGGQFGEIVGVVPPMFPASKPHFMGWGRDNGFGTAQKNALNQTLSLSVNTRPDSLLDLFVTGDAGNGWRIGNFMRQSGTWEWRHTNGNALGLTTAISPTSPAPYKDEAGVPLPAGQLFFRQDFWVPSLTVPGRFRKVTLQ